MWWGILTAFVAATAAAAAADFGVGEAKDVGHQFSQVCQTQQHYRYANQRVRDAHQSTPECLRRDIAVTWWTVTISHTFKQSKCKCHRVTSLSSFQIPMRKEEYWSSPVETTEPIAKNLSVLNTSASRNDLQNVVQIRQWGLPGNWNKQEKDLYSAKVC